ncbi:MAG: C40 family peptidase [Firmicutes bacterium]|nr:C40 family peptidase [Bacillota bacterium]
MDIRQEALLAAAYDYYNHNEYIQYDQLSMDRFLQITPRRRKYFPPEAGTSQHTHHLDCSGFCFAVYYQALGLELPYDITWHMYENMAPLVYKYEKTFDETLEEKQKIADEFTAALQPGDLITLLHQGKSGHIVLYVGDGKFMHCCPVTLGKDDSYNYTAKSESKCRNNILLNNIADITRIITGEDAGMLGGYCRYNLFSPRERMIAIHRPWLQADGPTEQAMIRMGAHKGLVSCLESSHPGGRQAVCGDVVEYRVHVKNAGGTAKSVTVDFTAPAGTSFGGETVCEAKLEAGEERNFTFGVIVEAEDEIYLEAPQVHVNGLTIPGRKVLLAPAVNPEDKEKVVNEIREKLAEGMEVMKAAAEVYGRHGITMSGEKKTYIRGLFHHFDTCARENNNILVRKSQNPFEDMAVYSLFGGKGVVTGDIVNNPDQRTTEIMQRDLQAGDIILCGNDPYAVQTHALFYTGDSLIGAAEQGLTNRELKDDELEAFMRSLFGRFCFVVLRPWQMRCMKS